MANPIPSVFYLTDCLLIAYAVSQRRVTEVRRFHLSAEDQAEFTQWLRESGIKPIYHPIYIVVDSRLEEYQIDTIPHVRGHNRKDLLNHRLRRLYSNAKYTHATIIGRAKNRNANKRQDDHALFLALNNAQSLQPWIRLLLTQRISIHGIYSLPLLSQQVIAPLDLPDNVLLINHTEYVAANNAQGLRQSFFHKGRLEASRLILLPHFSQNASATAAHTTALSKKETYPSFLHNEIHKTLQYLIGHALLTSDEILTILLFGEPQTLLDVKQFISKHPTSHLQFRFYIMSDFLAQNHLSQSPQPAYFHFLPIKQVAAGKTPNHYAQAGETFYDNHLKLRQKILLGSFFILLLGALLGGFVAYQAWQIQQENTAIQSSIAHLEHEQKKHKELVGSDIAPRHMRNAVEAAQKLRGNQLKPHKALTILGQALQDFPALKLRRIKWEVQEITNKKEQKVKGDTDFLNLLQKTLRDKGQLDTTFNQVIEIEGQVWSLRHNLAQAQRAFESFLNRLRKQPNLRIEVLKQPLDALNNAFQETLKQDKKNANASFTLKLTFSPPKTLLKQ